MKIKHEDKTVERWVNESISAAEKVLGTGRALVAPQVVQGLAATHLLAIIAGQDDDNMKTLRGCERAAQLYKAAALALVQAFPDV